MATTSSPRHPAHTPARVFSPSRVARVVRALIDASDISHASPQLKWLAAVGVRAQQARPDLAAAVLEVLDVEPSGSDVLRDLTIGEVGVCYEALLAELDRKGRKDAGQFFTPDDAAAFLASRSRSFMPGRWLDPCCGVGNLSWHLAAAQADPAEFVRERLTLLDLDPVALKTAISMIALEYLAAGDVDGVHRFASRCVAGDFLGGGTVPEYDYAILNPPYAKAAPREGFSTASTRDLFAYFLERVAETSRGFVSVTPASYLSAPKYRSVRSVIQRYFPKGDVYTFDNVPDTLFRGYKFGSNNSSKTNFVRAAVTVCAPGPPGWRTTPIMRWRSVDRVSMFRDCERLLAPREIGPAGEWAKIGPELWPVWRRLADETKPLSELVAREKTEFAVEVASTPRYYVSASLRTLDRGSKIVLHFANREDRDRALLALNSSLPYIWWRMLDGGVTLSRRVLLSTPIPTKFDLDQSLLQRIRRSEQANVVIKLNAGRVNENIKHSRSLVKALDKHVLRESRELHLTYSSSMFPLPE